MLIGIGKINVSSLIDSIISMAKDETSDHELNQNTGRGTWIHKDGWGISYLDKDNKWQVFRSTRAIFEDKENVDRFRNLETNYVMLHVRYKMGSEVHIQNTHPFHLSKEEYGDYIFCHNGYAGEDFTFHPTLIPQGQTDSEKLYCSILSSIKDKKLNLKANNQSTTNTIAPSIYNNVKKAKVVTGTNVFLSTKRFSFFMMRENNYPNYYQLHIGSNQDCTIISSEILTNLDNTIWVKSPAGQVLSINHNTLNVKTEFTGQMEAAELNKINKINTINTTSTINETTKISEVSDDQLVSANS